MLEHENVVTVKAVGETTRVSIHVDTELKVSAEQAQDLIRRFLRHVGPFLRAETPLLRAGGERLAWLVPVVMSLPEHGDLGVVDWLTVDAEGHGSPDIHSRKARQLAYQAQALAQALPPEKVPPEFKVRVPAMVAQRKVGVWLVMHVGDMLHGDPPQLVEGERIVWSVPVILSRHGEVAHVEVDADTGEILEIGDELADRIRNDAIARTVSSPTG